MRIGENPLRKKSILPPYKRHRIIMPVYIPNHEGYFKEALAIFRMSLASLLATTDLRHTSITILDNESIPEIEAIVLPEVEAGRIDRYIRHGQNRGKADPVVGELKASYESLVTITDCDVLFHQGWQRQIEDVFVAFPAAGAVSPSPAPNALRHASATTWLYGALTFSIRRGNVVDQADLDQFEASIGKKIFDAGMRRSQFLLAGRNGKRALLGCGHFVVTLRQECYQKFIYEPGLGGTGIGEQKIDGQVDSHGLLRLATPLAHVKHMGNSLEPWMHERLAQILAEAPIACIDEDLPAPGLVIRTLALLPFRVRYLFGMGTYVIATSWQKLFRSKHA